MLKLYSSGDSETAYMNAYEWHPFTLYTVGHSWQDRNPAPNHVITLRMTPTMKQISNYFSWGWLLVSVYFKTTYLQELITATLEWKHSVILVLFFMWFFYCTKFIKFISNYYNIIDKWNNLTLCSCAAWYLC